MTRTRMIRRAVIERNIASGSDAYGQPIPPLWQVQAAAVPCWIWTRTKRVAVDALGTMLIEDIRALFPKGADVHEGDRVARFTDRLGVIVWDGPMEVQSLVPRPDHLEAALRRVD